MANTLTNLLGLDLKGLEGFFVEIGEKPFRARQLLQWIHQYRVTDFAEMSNLSKSLREKLSQIAEIRVPELLHEHISTDGTRKWIIRWMVIIPSRQYLSLKMAVALYVCHHKLVVL